MYFQRLYDDLVVYTRTFFFILLHLHTVCTGHSITIDFFSTPHTLITLQTVFFFFAVACYIYSIYRYIVALQNFILQNDSHQVNRNKNEKRKKKTIIYNNNNKKWYIFNIRLRRKIFENWTTTHGGRAGDNVNFHFMYHFISFFSNALSHPPDENAHIKYIFIYDSAMETEK